MVATAYLPLVNAIISTMSAASGLESVRVFDGPAIDESYPGSFLAVGHDGSDDGDVTSGNGGQQYLELGNRKQFEDGSVNCWLVAWSGDTNVSTQRSLALGYLSAIDTALRADPSFGGACLYSSIDNWSVQYRQTNAGVVCHIPFQITYRART